jgi:hypothetical protein
VSEAHKPLTARTVLALADIVQVAESGGLVRRLAEGGAVLTGVARHLVTSTDTLTFPDGSNDVRDCYLRVTSGITDQFWPVAELIEQHADGEFVIY